MGGNESKNIDKSFVKVKCPNCGNEQIIFLRASTIVSCNVCGSTLAVPTGGKAEIKGEILEVYA